MSSAAENSTEAAATGLESTDITEDAEQEQEQALADTALKETTELADSVDNRQTEVASPDDVKLRPPSLVSFPAPCAFYHYASVSCSVNTTWW